MLVNSNYFIILVNTNNFPTLWRRTKRSSLLRCSAPTRNKDTIWGSDLHLVQLWPSVSFFSSRWGSGPGPLLTPSSWSLRMGTWDSERLFAGTICSSLEIQLQPLCAGSGGPLLWDPPLDGGSAILGTLPSEGGLRVSEETGGNFSARRRASGL